MDKPIVTKWYTIVEIVDIETGEVISKSEYERRNLRIIKKIKKHEIRGTIGTIRHEWHAREHEQTKMEL